MGGKQEKWGSGNKIEGMEEKSKTSLFWAFSLFGLHCPPTTGLSISLCSCATSTRNALDKWERQGQSAPPPPGEVQASRGETGDRLWPGLARATNSGSPLPTALLAWLLSPGPPSPWGFSSPRPPGGITHGWLKRCLAGCEHSPNTCNDSVYVSYFPFGLWARGQRLSHCCPFTAYWRHLVNIWMEKMERHWKKRSWRKGKIGEELKKKVWKNIIIKCEWRHCAMWCGIYLS